MHAADFVGGDRAAVAIDQVETRAGIADDDRAVTQIAGHARGRRHAHVGADAEQHHAADAEAAQAQVEVGADEGGVDGLAHDGFAVARLESGTERVAGMVRTQRGAGLDRIMAHVQQRPAALPPRREQALAVGFHGRVVARRPRWVVEARCTSIGISAVCGSRFMARPPCGRCSRADRHRRVRRARCAIRSARTNACGQARARPHGRRCGANARSMLRCRNRRP